MKDQENHAKDRRPGKTTQRNIGMLVSGGHATANGPVVGRVDGDLTIEPSSLSASGTMPGPATASPSADSTEMEGADVGILTVLPVEQRAVVEALRRLPGYRWDRPSTVGPRVHRVEVGPPGQQVRVAAMQMVDRGPDAAGVAHLQLVQALSPDVVLLVGIAGGVRPGISIGDVVLSDTVVRYDPRRVAEDGVHHRGDTYVVTAAVRHRLNEFMVETGGEVAGPQGEVIRVRQGPIGSGSAVITDPRSEDRDWLLHVNEKLLAVETEAAGMAQAFYQVTGPTPRPFGWVTVRGVSDNADAAKGHEHHELASRHAAAVTMELLPYLRFSERAAER